MKAARSLSSEQKSVLVTIYHFLEIATIYLGAVMPVVRETDEQMLKGILELGETCLNRLPNAFPELQPLSAEREKRGGL